MLQKFLVNISSKLNNRSVVYFSSKQEDKNYFENRDIMELINNDYEADLPRQYRKLRDNWKIPLKRKQERRAKKIAYLEELKQKGEFNVIPQEQKLVIHESALGIEYPQNQDQIFAVVKVGGFQHKICVDDLLVNDYLPYKVNEQIVFDQVMLIGTKYYTSIGRPLIKNAKVYATVEEQTQSRKLTCMKKKRRKGYKRAWGVIKKQTILRIDRIVHELTNPELNNCVQLSE